MKAAENLAPALSDSQAATRRVMLNVANQIPDPEDRKTVHQHVQRQRDKKSLLRRKVRDVRDVPPQDRRRRALGIDERAGAA
jgi:hypothetical protein